LDLTSGQTFWLAQDGPGQASSPLAGDHRCDVAIVGAGISGALVADAVSAAGASVVVLDQRDAGLGSTSASTALIQYELDEQLHQLIDKVGRVRAVDTYRAALYGVRRIARLASELGQDVGFRKQPSLYLASRKSDVRSFRRECAARRRVKLPCRFLDPKALADVGEFDAPAALWSTVGGEVDPLRLARGIFRRCRDRPGFEIHGSTRVERIKPGETGLEVDTDRGLVRAKKVIVAAGYESEKFLPGRVAKLHSTYAVVTEPVRSFEGWRKRCLIWDSGRPYLYIRTTADNRIIIGGEDDPFRNPELRDSRVPKKAQALLKKARRLFPRMSIELAGAWAGTFAETEDGLPYIGPHPELDQRILFALAYGANGMPFSAIAADVLSAAVSGRRHRYSKTFSFDR